MHHSRILVVDDEPAIIKLLRANLHGNGYEVLAAMDGAEALQTIEKELPDLIILDIMMPKMDGFEVARQVREWSQIPIIMLSARGNETDKVNGLDLGADDYLSQPFGTRELLARVGAVLRRTNAARITPTQVSFKDGNLQINFAQRRVMVAGNEVRLTPTEYAILQELVLNAGKVITHAHLLNKVWGPEYRDEKEYLHVFVGRLRAKVETDPTNPIHIVTVPGIGYKFQAMA